MKLLQRLKEYTDWRHVTGAAVTFGLLALTYWLSTWVKPGILTWGLVLPADLIMLLTCLARLNDMSRTLNSKRWQFRRMGFIYAAVGIVGVICLPFEFDPGYPTWKGVLFHWGVALAWLTTPGMPPWHKYISGEFRQKDIKNGTT